MNLSDKIQLHLGQSKFPNAYQYYLSILKVHLYTQII